MQYCDVDGVTRTEPGSKDWANDRVWGWVHRGEGWHTITGTLLNGNPQKGFVLRTSCGRPDVPALPALPDVAAIQE